MFITHFHKTLYLLTKRIFWVNLLILFQILPLHTTSHPNSTLYTFYKFLASSIRYVEQKFETYTSTGHIAMVSFHCGFWGDLSTCWKFKKWNAFSAWWCGMGSHHCGQSFCCPLFYPGSEYGTFVFAATFKSVALSIIQLSKWFQHEQVCQNCRTFVKQNMLSSWW